MHLKSIMKLFRPLFFLSILCSLFFSCQEKSGPLTPEKLFEQYRKSVVLIRNQFYLKISMGDGRVGYICGLSSGFTEDEAEARKNPLTAYGTGFFIAEDGKIATNRHVAFPDYQGNELMEALKERMKSFIGNAGTQKQALTDSISEISNYIEEHADQISATEMDELTQKKEALQARIDALNNGGAMPDMEAPEVKAIPVSIGIAYDNTFPGNNDSYHPCSILEKSNTEDIDLAILQLKDKTTPSSVTKIFTFEDQNPNIKNGTSDKEEAYDINKQLTIDKKLYLIGYNYGEELANTTNGLKVQFTQGTVSQESDEYKVLYSIPSLPGSSGSPVIDQWGNLVAINYAGIKNSQSFNYGILAKHLKNMLMNTPSAKGAVSGSKKAKPASTSGIDYDAKIRNFIALETSRNFEEIYACFAPNMRRYWDLKNPTKEQLAKRYSHSWDITTHSENEIQQIKEVDEYTYNVYTVYSYTNNKNESKQMKTTVRYEFDAYGKIVETYGL
jgi:hypothetical protein